MEHSHSEPETHDGDDLKPGYDDVNTPVIVLTGVLSAIITLLIIMLVQGMCYQWQNSYLKERDGIVNTPARELIEAQKKVLDGGEGIMPISEAMEKVVSTYGK